MYHVYPVSSTTGEGMAEVLKRAGIPTALGRINVHQYIITSIFGQSDPRVDKGLFRLNPLDLCLIVSRVDFILLVLFLEAFGVREYRCMAIESRLEALCFVRSPRATRASRVTNPRPSGLMALDLAESRQSYVRGVAIS